MALMDDGGTVVVGETDSQDGELGDALGGRDAFALRVDADGNILWKRRFGGSLDDAFTQVLSTPDGGVVALGTTTSTDGDARASRGGMDAFLVRLNESGETLWIKCLGGTLDDELLTITRGEDGMLFVAGRTKSRNGDLRANFGGYDAWAALLLPEDGKPLWVVRYGQGGDDRFIQAMPTYEGWLLLGEIAEEQLSEEGAEPTWMPRPVAVMLGSDGQEPLGGEEAPRWPITLGGTGENRLVSILETDVGWMLSGETNSRSALMPSPRGGLDLWLLYLRQGGYMLWQRVYGGSKDERLHSIRQLPEGGYVLLGTTESSDGQVTGAHGAQDVWLLRVSAGGVLEWQQTIGGGDRSVPAGMLALPGGGFLVAGWTLAQDGDFRPHASVRTGFLAKLSVNGNLERVQLVGGAEECTILDLKASPEAAYLLGKIRTISADGIHEALWLSRLAPECYPGE